MTMNPNGSYEPQRLPRLDQDELRRHLESMTGLALCPRRLPPWERRLHPEIHRVRELVQPPLLKAVESCCKGESAWPLFVHGPAGTGKTCAALWLIDTMMGVCQMWSFSQLCEHLLDAKFNRLESFGSHSSTIITPADVWEDWRRMALCVIDELGSRSSVSDHQYEVAQRAIDDREGKPLMVASNLELPRLAEIFDDRIASRLAGGTVVHLTGDDMRLAPSRG